MNGDIPKSSSFIVTINSNQTPNSLKQKGTNVVDFQKKMIEALTFALNERSMYMPVQDNDLKESDILSIVLDDIGAELSPQKNTYHLHAYVTVKYKNDTSGYFHINIKELKKTLLTILPLTDVYINITFARKHTQTISNYIQKNRETNPDFDLNEYLTSTRRNKQAKKRGATEAIVTPDPPAKRKRGRPRKIREGEADKNNQVETEAKERA
jgi:hypothetical protein